MSWAFIQDSTPLGTTDSALAWRSSSTSDGADPPRGLYELGDVCGGNSEAVLVLVTEHRRWIEVLGLEGQAVHASGNGDMQRIALPQRDRGHAVFTSRSSVRTITVPRVLLWKPVGDMSVKAVHISERSPP